jgi:cell wall-associated NlpC family hydrolase
MGRHHWKTGARILLIAALTLGESAVFTTLPQSAVVVFADQVGQTDETAATEKNDTSSVLDGYDNPGIAVVSDYLNVRKKASASSTIVGRMANYGICEVLGTSGNWTRIKSGKVTGYVSSRYLVTGKEAKTLALKNVTTVATVSNEKVRVHKTASTSSTTLSLVSKGDDLVVKTQKGSWYKVEIDNKTGYVSESNVEVSEKLPTARTIDSTTDTESTSDTRTSLVNYAKQFVGNPYSWGGTSLTKGVDCSGFTMQIYAHYGVSLPHSSSAQPSYGKKIKASNAQPGDLFFYGSGKSINHVGIYIGNGKIVHASNARDGIKISSAYYQNPICVVSYLN